MGLTVLSWGKDARVVLDGVSRDAADDIASRWDAGIESECPTDVIDRYRLVVPDGSINSARRRATAFPPVVKIRFRNGVIDVNVGPHCVVLDTVTGSDRIEVSPAARLDDAERELLVGVSIAHLLARQGLAVLHACAFQCGGVGVLGLGEGLSGKTTVSLAAVHSGGAVVSDDLVLAGLNPEGSVELRSLRPYWFLRGETRNIVPKELSSKMWETEENGQPRWLIPSRGHQIDFVDRLTPRVLWQLSVDRRLKASRVTRADQASSFATLITASSPIFLSRYCPGERKSLLPVLRALSERCRPYRIRLGRNLHDDPEGETARLLDSTMG